MSKYLAVVIIILAVIAAIFGYLLFKSAPAGNNNAPVKSNKNNMMKITSPAFSNDENIPQKFTCDGTDVNPELLISGVPADAKSLVLIIGDPDAPNGLWTHWVLWNINSKITGIKENSVPEGAVLGKNSSGVLKYEGPCPPAGIHRYYFKIYALDTVLDMPQNSGRAEILKAMEGHIVGQAELMGRYSRFKTP